MPVNKPRRRGSYAPLSATYFQDDKIIEAGERAELLYIRGLAFCAQTLQDGFISDAQLTRFPGAGLPQVQARAAALVKIGLWTKEPSGYRVTTWLQWNRSADEIRHLNQADANRKGEPHDTDE